MKKLKLKTKYFLSIILDKIWHVANSKKKQLDTELLTNNIFVFIFFKS